MKSRQKNRRIVNKTPRSDSGKKKGTPIPREIDSLISSYIRTRTGHEISDPVFLKRLRQSILAQKSGYWNRNPTGRYGRIYDIYAYLAYHLPVYLTQAYRLLLKLDREGVLPENIRLLDLGSGPGVISLAALMVQNNRNHGEIEIYAVERSDEHIHAYQHLVPGYASGTEHAVIHDPLPLDLRQDSPPEISSISVLTIQNVLAELTDLSINDLTDLIMRYVSHMTEDGVVLITEPAEFRHSTRLRELQNELIGRGLHLYAPCRYPWGARCHPTACWTFWESDPIAPTALMSSLADDTEGFRFTNIDVKCSYAVFTLSPSHVDSYRLPRGCSQTRLSHLRKKIGDNISVVGTVVSSDIGDRRYHVFKICDGTCKEPVFVIIPKHHHVPGSDLLLSAEYGDLLLIDRVQVRWNSGKRAFNLMITEHSRIRQVPAGKKKGDKKEGLKE